MTISVLVIVELALIVVALGVILLNQNNNTLSNVVGVVIVLAGLICMVYAFSKNVSGTIQTKDVPVFGKVYAAPDKDVNFKLS